jgi:hypothetical protein
MVECAALLKCAMVVSSPPQINHDGGMEIVAPRHRRRRNAA